MFGLGELKRKVAYLEFEKERLQKQYWDLSSKHDYLCRYFGLSYAERHIAGYEAKGGPSWVHKGE